MKEKWLELINEMVDVYGVHSCFENVNSWNSLDEEGLWFECPHCGEPILMEDWSFEEVQYCCPVCEEEWD